MQKRIEFPRSERGDDGCWREVGRADLDAHLANGWRVVHLAGSGTSNSESRYCAIVEAPPGLDSNGRVRP